MPILKNALDSIALGIEDYELAENDDRRFISCTRNIFAGILLLFKHKLSDLSPTGSDEILIKQKIMPRLNGDQLLWVGEGTKTVDVQGIKDRFKHLDIEVDWVRLDEINKYRNAIEHYHSPALPAAVKKLISNSFLVIADFIRDYLDEDPRNLLSPDVYDVMKDIQEVYQKDKEFCSDRFRSLTYFSNSIYQLLVEANCLECDSDLIGTADRDISADSTTYICRSCNEEYSYEDFVTQSFEKKYELTHRDIANGAEDTSCACPECGGYFLYHEGICAICGHEDSLICDLCEDKIHPSEVEVFEGRCSYCNYKWEKIMAE